MKTIKNLMFFLIIAMTVFVGCDLDDDDDVNPDKYYPSKILIVVDNDVYSSVKSNVDDYVDDIREQQNTDGIIYKWESGTAEDLRTAILDFIQSDTISGVFLVGDLPAAWYEMETDWKVHEEFPFDIFYGATNTDFTDSDSDGKYDGHSTLDLKLFVGRIDGSSTEINNYFTKNHDYRINGALVAEGAYLFIDDDWQSMYATQTFNIQNAVPDLEVCVNLNATTSTAYLNKLKGAGALYVHQLIHSYPSRLAIDHEGATQYITASEVVSENLKGSFYQMFNCSGARFTEDCLGMTYVMKTSYGLAVQGTTKTGGNYWPQDFNNQLGAGKSWGEAFIYWFDSGTGGNYLDEKWKMGLVLLGDPMLRLTTATAKTMSHLNESLPVIDPEKNVYDREEIDNLIQTFEQYKAEKPQHFL